TDLFNDGWVVIQPQYAENLSPGLPQSAIYTDVSNDTGHGARYLAQTLHWWDHIVAWIKTTYGNWPIVVFGFSWGGLKAFQIAANRTSTITAYASHHAATVLSSIPSAVTSPADFTGISTAGLDTTSTMLNSVTVPGAIGWGTSDTVVGFTNIQAIYNA